jgi:NAD(P)-dependent dehydrogenase (short-subunit alcohol dehydrogenase family)
MVLPSWPKLTRSLTSNDIIVAAKTSPAKITNSGWAMNTAPTTSAASPIQTEARRSSLRSARSAKSVALSPEVRARLAIATETVTPAYWDDRIAVNLKHQFFAAQAVLPDFVAANQGVIVNFGSTSWLAGQGGMAAYSASKAGVLGLTRSLARDYGVHNVRVNAIAPGWIMTERQVEKWLTPEGEQELLKRQCLKRKLMPSEIARFTVFLASEEASACTAQHYIVDGGWV